MLTTVNVSLSATTIQAGQTASASAAAVDQYGAVIAVGSVVWTTGSGSIAIVNAAGTVTGISPGMTQVTAAAGGRQGQASISVVPIPVASLTIAPAAAALVAGATQQLTAITLDANSNVLTGRVVTWTSSDATKASVTASGLVAAVAAGSITITATSEGRSASAQVTVTFPTGGPNGIGFVGTTGPPGSADPAIAAGLDRIVVISNSEVVISTKTGTTIARMALGSFFQPAFAAGEQSRGDVAALFDEASGRFFLAEGAWIPRPTCVPGTCVGHNLVAVSKTSTPASLGTADWYFHAFDRTLERTASTAVATANWGDFDNLAANGDALIITSRRYRESDNADMGPMIRLLDKSTLIAGVTPSTWSDIGISADQRVSAGVMPARTFGTSPVQYFVSTAVVTAGFCGVTVWGLTGGLAAPVVVTQSVQLEGNCNPPRYGPQPAAAPEIDIGGSGPLARAAVFRNGRLWVARTWQQNFASGSVTAIKWAELNVDNWPGRPTVVQQGTVAADGVWSFMPALTVDPAGTMVLAFNTTSTAAYAAIHVAARYATDPLGTLRPATVVKGGTGAIVAIDGAGRNRFADYLSMELDPASGASWVHGQYGAAGGFQTWVAQIRP